MSDDLVQRLRGVYTVPVNDGAGTLFGSDTYTRTFAMPPICAEAADEIERLRAEVADREWESARQMNALYSRISNQEATIRQAWAERDAAFRMSQCECASAECCANLVKHLRRAESAESERDALRERSRRRRLL